MSIANLSIETTSNTRRVPMTSDVLRRLQANADHLAAQLPRLQALAQEDGVSGDPDSPTVLAAGDLHLAARRLRAPASSDGGLPGCGTRWPCRCQKSCDR